jgi:hypothetical protein
MNEITKEQAKEIWTKLEKGVITNKFEWSDTEHEALQLLNDLLKYISQLEEKYEDEKAYKERMIVQQERSVRTNMIYKEQLDNIEEILNCGMNNTLKLNSIKRTIEKEV